MPRVGNDLGARLLEFANWDSTLAARQEEDMEVLYPHCAGLDVHKETVVACMRHMVGGTVKREVRTLHKWRPILGPFAPQSS